MSQPAGLDVRWPLGLLFASIGALLGVYGLIYDNPAPSRASALHINVWWGGVLFIFGLVVLALAVRARQPDRQRAPTPM